MSAYPGPSCTFRLMYTCLVFMQHPRVMLRFGFFIIVTWIPEFAEVSNSNICNRIINLQKTQLLHHMAKSKHFHVAKLYAFKELVCHLQQAVTVLCAVVTDGHKNYLSSVFPHEKL